MAMAVPKVRGRILLQSSQDTPQPSTGSSTDAEGRLADGSQLGLNPLRRCAEIQ